MSDPTISKWPLGMLPTLAADLPEAMDALVIQRDQYGPPRASLRLMELPRPRLHPEDAGRVLVAVLATGPNFNTNFACLGLPVPVFGRATPPCSTSRAATPWASWWTPGRRCSPSGSGRR